MGCKKRYFREPIAEIYDAARYLDAAVSAHLNGHYETAKSLFMLANDQKVWRWTDSIWGRNSKYVVVRKQPGIHSMPRVKARMPDAAMKKALHERDGYHWGKGKGDRLLFEGVTDAENSARG
ncbi:hypothetical protein GMSM_41790 [Geomonas sp. Red276]